MNFWCFMFWAIYLAFLTRFSRTRCHKKGQCFVKPDIKFDLGWEVSWNCNNDQPKIDFSTYNQPNFNQISSIFQCWYFTFKLAWLLLVVVEKLISSWSLLHFNSFLNQMSSFGLVEEILDSMLNQHWFNFEELICTHWEVYGGAWYIQRFCSVLGTGPPSPSSTE